MRQFLAQGAIAAAPPSLVVMPQVGPEGKPWRYLYVANLTAGIVTVTIVRPGYANVDVGSNSILDLGCNTQYVQPITVLGGPGNVQLWVINDRDEAYQLGRIH